MSYYRRHIFFCLNSREAPRASCAQRGSEAGYAHCKMRVKKLGLSGKGELRVNSAGCLDRCDGGPVAVVYPEGTWYTFLDTDDIDEIIDSHLVNGVPVERLLLPPDVGHG